MKKTLNHCQPRRLYGRAERLLKFDPHPRSLQDDYRWIRRYPTPRSQTTISPNTCRQPASPATR